MRAWFAGLFIALGALGYQLAPDKVVGTAIFPLGLVLCYFISADLFTGRNLLLMQTLQKRLSVKKLVLKLVAIWVGNLSGAVTLGAIVYFAGIVENADKWLYKTTLPPGELIVKGVLCNVCVCLAVYAATQTQKDTAKIVLLYLPTFLFVMCGFEHCVANMYYLAAAGVGILHVGFWYNMLFVTVGNLIGGFGVAAALFLKLRNESLHFKN